MELLLHAVNNIECVLYQSTESLLSFVLYMLAQGKHFIGNTGYVNNACVEYIPALAVVHVIRKTSQGECCLLKKKL